MEIQRVGRPQGLTRAVRDEIERLIVSAGLKSGDRLPTEKELAEKLGAGRSSVREALGALQEIGMIEVVHGKGAFVRNQSQKAIEAHLHFLMNFKADAEENLNELRQLLEVDLVRLAAQRADAEDLAAIQTCVEAMAHAQTQAARVEAGAQFHLAVARAAKNPFATSIYEAVTQVINQVYQSLERSEDQDRQSLQDHTEIYRAIASRDADLAVQRAQGHLAHLHRIYSGG